jgi:hypothetical protein
VHLNRRSFIAGGVAASACAIPLAGRAQSTDALSKIIDAARKSSLPLDLAGRTWSGPGWNRLVAEGRAAQFFMLGEDHGMREIPLLAAALFQELHPVGYSAVSLEISEAAAQQIDRNFREGGVEAHRRWLAGDQAGIAFYDWAGEAAFLASIRKAVPNSRQAIFGTDYEPFATRQLAGRLASIAPNASARHAAADLEARIRLMRSEAGRSGNIAGLFGFSGKPKELQQIRAAFGSATGETALIIETLQQTLTINDAFLNGRRWQSNDLRAQWQRASFLRNWDSLRYRGRSSRMMLKYGANHMRRGLSESETFDLGTLVPELAQTMRSNAYQLMVIGGRGAAHSVLMPDFTYRSSPVDVIPGLDRFIELAAEQTSLFDLRALRALADNKAAETLDASTVRFIHGFDALLVIPHATPAQLL